MQFKHFIADYLLQGKYMLGKFKDKGWILPLSAHCVIHYLFTASIAVACGLSTFQAFLLGALDFTIHFIMDRIKASPKMLGRYAALSKNEMYAIIHRQRNNGLMPDDKELLKSNVLFWWSLGLDQMVHHLTDILIIYLIVSNLQ